MSERPSYVCRECEAPVTSGSYRARCPECGGTLRPRSYARSHESAAPTRGDRV